MAATTKSLSGWLRTGGAERVAAVLRHRPDTATPPPAHLPELCTRLSEPHSVFTALQGLDLPCLQVIETLQLLGSDAEPARLGELLGVARDPSVVVDLQRALDVLAAHALVWIGDGGRLQLTAALRNFVQTPHGLGAPLRPLLAELSAEHLTELARHTDLPGPTARKRDLVDVLADHLADPDRIRAALDTAPPDVVALLDELVWSSPRIEHHFRSDHRSVVWGPKQQRWLLAHGLLLPVGWAAVELPAEIGLVLRGAEYAVTLVPRPPPPRCSPVEPAAVDAAAGAAALAAIGAVGRLVECCEADSPVPLKTGGIGVRELRRLAKATASDEPTVRLWLTVAVAAGLLVGTPDGMLPAPAFDAWRGSDPSARLVPLLAAWWALAATPSAPRTDENGKPLAALAQHHHQGAADRELRADLLAAMRPDAAVDVAALTAELAWRRPMVHGGHPAELARPVHAVLAEAQLLGVVALGALSTLGAALRTGADTGAAAAALLPRALDTARLLPDLTAVVPGTPSAALAGLLDRVADRESRDAASTWRFSPASVRRALDAGDTVDGLRAELAAAAEGGLPQPLDYLLRDVGRRHGQLRVSAVGCCVLVDDPALLSEITHHRALRPLALRALAPTVLASGCAVAPTLEALRTAGYAPVKLDGSGAVTVERRPARRAEQRHLPRRPRRTVPPAAPPPPDDAALVALAGRLLAAGPRAPVTRSITGQLIRRLTRGLSAAEIAALADAVDQGTPVLIDYVSAAGDATSRVVEPTVFAPPMLVAWCHLRADERKFALDRIVAVSPAS